VPVSRSAGQTEGLTRHAECHAGEETQLHEFGGGGKVLRQPVEGVVESEQVIVAGGSQAGEVVEVDPLPSAAPLEPVAISGVVDQDAALASAAAAKK
jgi:hypothetical protein